MSLKVYTVEVGEYNVETVRFNQIFNGISLPFCEYMEVLQLPVLST